MIVFLRMLEIILLLHYKFILYPSFFLIPCVAFMDVFFFLTFSVVSIWKHSIFVGQPVTV